MPYTGCRLLDMLQRKRWEKKMEERKKTVLPVEQDFSVVCSNLDGV